jgi:hypothetical protein
MLKFQHFEVFTSATVSRKRCQKKHSNILRETTLNRWIFEYVINFLKLDFSWKKLARADNNNKK